MKKSGKKKKKKNEYDEVLACFEKLNKSIKMLGSVSKSLKTSAKVLKGPIKSNLSSTTENMKITAKIIENIKSTQSELIASKYSIFDANDLDII